MSLSTIAAMSRKAAKKASNDNLTPFIIEKDDINHYPPFPFPYIGDYIPEGWKLINTLFCDTSGCGADNEPALTVDQLLNILETGKGYAIIEEGQFQLTLGVFVKL